MTLDELDLKLGEVEARRLLPTLPYEKCPFCGSTLLNSYKSKEIEYIPPYHVNGNPLPKMTRWISTINCIACDYEEES